MAGLLAGIEERTAAAMTRVVEETQMAVSEVERRSFYQRRTYPAFAGGGFASTTSHAQQIEREPACGRPLTRPGLAHFLFRAGFCGKRRRAIAA